MTTHDNTGHRGGGKVVTLAFLMKPEVNVDYFDYGLSNLIKATLAANSKGDTTLIKAPQGGFVEISS
jgi:hypothetical protein